jgi:carboxyl-terminal processing protease
MWTKALYDLGHIGFDEPFKKLLNQGMKKMVLDLRNNPGGVMSSAIDIADAFLGKNNLILTSKGKNEGERRYYSSTGGHLEKTKLVVLINAHSASASEILAGAIQDNDRGMIVGRRSYGKGLIQKDEVLRDGSNLRLTIARYYTPSGRCIQRSYKGGYDNYMRDEERITRNEYFKQDSSVFVDSLKFKTKHGRVVYDGAGIMPDVKTPDEKFSNVLMTLISKNHIFNFATKYFLANSKIPTPTNFKLSDEAYNDFITYLKDKDYSYKTESELALEDLKKDAENDNYFNDIKTEYNDLLNKMLANKKDDLAKNKSQIKKYLEEEIIGRYYFQKGRVEFSLQNDDEIKESLKLINDNTKINTVLTTIDKATKPFNVRKKF